MSLQKAYIKLLEPSAGGPKGPTGQQVTFRFNPKEYAVQKSAEWKRSATKGTMTTSMPEFTGSGPRQLSLELFLDGSDERGDTARDADVGKDVEVLFSCLAPDPKTLSAQKPLPPFVQFGWGTKVLFTAFVKSVNAKYTLFREDGTPIRATCTLSLEELPEESKKQNPTSGALAPTRTHVVVDGDTLPSIAWREYGSPELWRALAEANEIDDPMRLQPGDRLLVPAADEAARAAG
jgi:hypothetical protein